MQCDELDIVVVGAGHAGCEAALSCARMGLSVRLYTLNADTVGLMPCNPSIGGLGKGHLVREIDALGGQMGQAADASCIQYKRLGTSKGPAVQGSRMQCDRFEYSLVMKAVVEAEPNLTLRQEMITGLIVHHGTCKGVRERCGLEVYCKAVILATGTFLNGKIHVGEVSYGAGRAGEFPSIELAAQIRALGLPMGCFKTGTPPRVKGSSLHLDMMEEDPGDEFLRPFSLRTHAIRRPVRSCFKTYTSVHTHEIVRRNLSRSPLYSGTIKGTPARYCPSLEDKIARFPQRERHLVVAEPEGLRTNEMYVKGLGNSLPSELQAELVQSVPGLEHAEIIRPAYAIEYEFIHPTGLLHTLETRAIHRLYLAGQINGTSGYEEAAAQGLWAGINAALAVKGLPPFLLDRSEAYMAVMVDDLVSRGVQEPYRMFTSRSEYRLLLREDNAALRLLKKGNELGLIPKYLVDELESKEMLLQRNLQLLETVRIKPSPEVNSLVQNKGGKEILQTLSGKKFLKRPEITVNDLIALEVIGGDLSSEERNLLEIMVKYEGYIERQRREASRAEKMEHALIPDDLDFQCVPGLSREMKDRLMAARPRSLGHMSRIPGVTPAALTAVMVGLRNRRGLEQQKSTRPQW
ncbi:MAG: tRNA uridine 5-carboxymethylaminomethyl modification enzyme [Thermodesulfobacteriota bacterium]|nr:tRNA uridine 5-carboxymethylaminomethyl modification enzyme [Thermodesulfobacteriota bacterium]